MSQKPKKVEVPLDRPLTYAEYNKLLEHAYSSGFWQATRYARTTKQIKDKLAEKGYPQFPVKVEFSDGDDFEVDFIAETIYRLETAAVLDDRHYARNFIERRLGRGMGMSRIKAELNMKGLEKNLVEEVIEELTMFDEQAEENALKEEFEKVVRSSTVRNTDPMKRKQKVVQRLASRGFPIGDVLDLLRDYSFED